jgi:hypothetical protein|tara:strand:- start:166 stop:342 length:177 start_codon:yes stop_codon:yes gene_type:complete
MYPLQINSLRKFFVIFLSDVFFKTKGISSSVSSGLQYTLPRMKQATNEVREDLPLFIQ